MTTIWDFFVGHSLDGGFISRSVSHGCSGHSFDRQTTLLDTLRLLTLEACTIVPTGLDRQHSMRFEFDADNLRLAGLH